MANSPQSTDASGQPIGNPFMFGTNWFNMPGMMNTNGTNMMGTLQMGTLASNSRQQPARENGGDGDGGADGIALHTGDNPAKEKIMCSKISPKMLLVNQ